MGPVLSPWEEQGLCFHPDTTVSLLPNWRFSVPSPSLTGSMCALGQGVPPGEWDRHSKWSQYRDGVQGIQQEKRAFLEGTWSCLFQGLQPPGSRNVS